MSTRVLAIDPGKTTGFAFFDDEKRRWDGEIRGGVDGFIGWWRENIDSVIDSCDVIVVEDYISDGTTTGRVWSSEIIGAIKGMSPDRIPVVLQKRGAKRSLIGQSYDGDRGQRERFDWLEGHGFEPIGGKHNLDAITHAIVYLKLKRHPGIHAKYFS